jgi:hypothetical protein
VSHLDLVLATLGHFRNRGADLAQIRHHVSYRAPGTSGDDDRAALDELIAAGQLIHIGQRYYLAPAAYKLARGSAPPGEWEYSDSWILLAILMCRDNCSVADLMPVCDYINHALPEEDEVHSALNRLVAAKLINVRKAGITATDTALVLHDKAKAEAGNNVRALPDALRRLLACPHCGVALGKVRWKRYTDPATFRAT